MKKLITLLLLIGGFVCTASAYYSLPGSWTIVNGNWDISAHQFENNTVTISLLGNTEYQFKFYNSDGNGGVGSWSGAQNDGATMTYSDCTGWWFDGTWDVHLKTTISGVYTFTLSWVGEGNTTPSISITYPTSYTRSVTPGNFGTICLPYAATVTGATIFKIVSTVGSGDSMTGINIESVGSLEEGKPYIFKATGSTLTATLSGTPVVEPVAAFGMAGNLSSTALSVSAGDYIIKNNKLCKVVVAKGDTKTYVDVPQYRAYILGSYLSSLSEAARSANFIGFDEEVDGIENIQSDNSQKNTVYNLNGQRVTDNKKGLLIVNGQKMLIK